ncbi:DNA helicase RecQ [Dysosmobacter sp. NSJ-60]|uniref:DNA helicase RecQ n=2 Tax=Pusillibacter faecalis TaxID=2714358 RepID=A0A810QH33_9FIRM|nr:DNA helicase RecQ [Pusillibacter faecalis]MBC5747826.1 DNA helicase RecQ [Dysosmobacter hominis]BCK85146.1 ATP-dependent DNA helicase RecQ [Pusillibacter faecalis]
MTKEEALKTYFGYDAFRGGQEPVIDALLSGRDAMGIMPTGAGKSVCYQIPALLLPGITLVISPLVSLMRDQVTQLVQMGVPAAYLNSTLTFKQYLLALERARAGRYKIIYVAPERLETEGFQSFAQAADISLVAVDEAHCISQWGQDFRPSYLNIPAFVEGLLRRPPVGAFTATATPEVQEDIARLLSLRNPLRITTGFNRENLYFEVRQPSDKRAALLELVRSRPGKCGIVYCSTRKAVEEVCALLRERGVSATRYHAGLEPEERQRNQEDFLYDRALVMVSTNAFGMGIDKSDVRYVIHYNMPKDLESYYQEAGRAGRDGLPSSCILLFSGQDVRTGEFLITHGEPREELDAKTAELLRERDLQRLRRMTAYCRTQRCLRQYLLQYFGEFASDYCGACYNCLHNFEEVDVSREAQIIVRCVAELGQHFGVGVVAETLCGADTEKIRKFHMEREPSYGLLKDLTQVQVRERIRFLLDTGTLQLSSGPYPVVLLGKPLSADTPLLMRVAREESSFAKRRPPEELDDRQSELFSRLRVLRASVARRQGVPAYVVFSDKTLRELAVAWPQTIEEFRAVSGVGDAKAARYGKAFLAEIDRFSR